jgi:hypothetical protein
MHEPYDDYDDYDEDYYDYDYGNPNDLSQFYFKFHFLDHSALSEWLYKVMNIEDFPFKQIPVNSWHPNADKGQTCQYLGSNYQGSPIWKTIYFVCDPINIEYKLHIQSHASHFVKQPSYYKGLHDILN